MARIGWIVGGVLGTAAIAGVALAMGGDGKRPPHKGQVVPPQTPEEVAAVKQVICTCYRGGATTEGPLVTCALRQVYEGVPFPSQPGDDPSLAEVEKRFGVWARELLAQPSAAAREAWCGTPGEVDPDLPPPPVDDTKARIRTIAESLIVETPIRNTLFAISQGHAGIETAARQAFEAAGVQSPSYQKLVLPLMKSMSAGKRWNRKLYSRKKDPNKNEYYATDGRTINPAWLPRNDDARAALLTGRTPVRTINDAGNKTGGGSSYGLVWIPDFDVDLAQQGVFDALAIDPPAEMLDLLGL